jgi:hypothetical protein
VSLLQKDAIVNMRRLPGFRLQEALHPVFELMPGVGALFYTGSYSSREPGESARDKLFSFLIAV